MGFVARYRDYQGLALFFFFFGRTHNLFLNLCHSLCDILDFAGIFIVSSGKVSHNMSSRYSLTSTTIEKDCEYGDKTTFPFFLPLTGNNHGLVGLLSYHTSIRILGNSKQMRLQLSTSLTGILLNDVRLIQRHTCERIGSDQDNTGIGIDVTLKVTCTNCVQDYKNVSAFYQTHSTCNFT